MSTANHYFIEKNGDRQFAVRAKGSEHASTLFPIQAVALAHAKTLNPDDHPNAERVRNVAAGGPDEWRKAN